MGVNGKGLGRGLDALFQDNSSRTESQSSENNTGLLVVSPESLAPNPGQPREDFNEEKLAELAQSIRENGILQPLLVRQTNQPGSYQIIAGERRWRAAQLAGLKEIPVIVKEFNDTEALIAALLENIQREDLNPIEMAKALVALQNLLGVTQDGLAEKLGKQRGVINNQIRILRLSPEAQEDIIKGRLTVGHARAIAGLPAGDIAEKLRARIVEKGYTVRQAEEAVAFWKDHDVFPWENPDEDRMGVRKDPRIRSLAEKIGTVLKCQTRISGNTEHGRISLTYESMEQLNALLEMFGLSLSDFSSDIPEETDIRAETEGE